MAAAAVNAMLVVVPAFLAVWASAIFVPEETEDFQSLAIALFFAGVIAVFAMATTAAAGTLAAGTWSPGRRLTRLVIQNTDGTPIDPWIAGARNLLITVPVVLPYGIFLSWGAAAITLAAHQATWWDLATRTKVSMSTDPVVSPYPWTYRARIAAGWMIAIPWLPLAIMLHPQSGLDLVALRFVATGMAVASLLWLCWPMPKYRWRAPTLVICVTVLLTMPNMLS